MQRDKKIRIGKYEYQIMEDDERNEYLYRYDADNGIGIKLKFCKEISENSIDVLKNMLKKQYIDRILKDF